MRPFSIDIVPTNVDPNGLCAAIDGAGPWTIADAEFVANNAADELAHQLNLTSTANLSAITITLVGTDADDFALTEAIAGPNNNTIETTSYFKTLTGVTAGATLGANTMDIGWVDEVMTKTYALDYRARTGATYGFTETGTIAYNVQESFQRYPDSGDGSPAQEARWITNVATGSVIIDGSNSATAVRILVTSYTNTAEMHVDISQGASGK
jgi:hypothetical protein